MLYTTRGLEHIETSQIQNQMAKLHRVSIALHLKNLSWQIADHIDNYHICVDSFQPMEHCEVH